MKISKNSLKPIKPKFDLISNLNKRKITVNFNFDLNKKENDEKKLISFDLEIEKENVDSEPKIIDFGCGSNHIIVLTENREIYACGLNFCGQLGYYFIN